MAEFKFVLKCIGITTVIMFALQFEVGGARGEKYVADYLRDGGAVVWVRDSMKGATKLIANTSADLAPKLSLNHLWPKTDAKAEARRHTSSDIQTEVPADFPDEEVIEEPAQKASVF